MDLATLIGIGMAFAGIFGAQIMEGGSPSSIILPAPLILVVLGTLGAAMASGVLKDATGMVNQMDLEGFGSCSNEGECQAVCPKGIRMSNIARMVREYTRAALVGGS